APVAVAESNGIDVFSPFDGESPLVEMKVKVGDSVTEGQILGAVEAMKANYNFKAPVNGTVETIHVSLGDEVGAADPILTILPK
ncbi:MAG TPA: acetyl-CoA carboxylase biotin carboxyl carrier protein subunit, partial [Bacteroidetes bacterium]|nr:acetyl-CoA carboxylase biotin carboxyl carrier protein subunit [Bacteroidota bacterium]HEX04843.1 acetyl-CoA carboxylase biotin carboxyl carrier protein subunit [Bacteroidota bacterium]